MEKLLSLNKFLKTYLMLAFCQISFLLGSQNLVPNSSFEEEVGGSCFTVTTNTISTVDFASGWSSSPNQGTADLYCTCKGNGSSFYILNNMCGSQIPRSDSSYAGIVVYDAFDLNKSEYIQVKLTDTLTTYQAYEVGFYVSIAEGFKYELRNIGAYLGDTIIYSGAALGLLNYTPQIVNDTSNSLYNPNGWILVKDTLYANGNEKYLVIGNFFNDANSIVYLHTAAWGGGYYFIDDVFVTPIPGLVGLPKSKTKKTQLQVYPNPNTGEFYIESDAMFGQQKIIQIFDMNGKLLHDDILPALSNKYIISLKELGNGVYFYKIKDDNRKGVQSGKLIIIKE